MKFLQHSKWNFLLTLVLILGLGLFTGCGDDDDPLDPGGGNLTAGTITATVDGSALNFSENSGASNPTDPDLRYISGGTQSSGDVIIINVPSTANTYTIPNAGDTSIIITHDGTTWTCVSGSVLLTTATDTRLGGSFIGTFEDPSLNTILVTNGALDVPLVLVQ